MALVNVAEILAARGYRVIVADWDLEAPGLERYLLSRDTAPVEYHRLLDGFLTRDGIIDLLRDYKASLTRPVRVRNRFRPPTSRSSASCWCADRPPSPSRSPARAGRTMR